MASQEAQKTSRSSHKQPPGGERGEMCVVDGREENLNRPLKYSCSVQCYDWFLLMFGGMFAGFDVLFETKMFCSYKLDESIIDRKSFI